MMRRFGIILSLCFCLTAGGLAYAQDVPVPVIGQTPSATASTPAWQRSQMELADDALTIGLTATAADLYTKVLSLPQLSAQDRETASLGLSTAYIERSKIKEAREILNTIPYSPAKALREGMLAVLDDNFTAAIQWTEKINPNQLVPQDVAWLHALRGFIASHQGDTLKLNQSILDANQSVVSEIQKQRIEILNYRSLIMAGKIDDTVIAHLREKVKLSVGTPNAFAYQRSLALALARQNLKSEAASILLSSAQRSPTEQAEADLLAGLILGIETADGRKALMHVAKNPAATSLRLTALRALVAAAAEAKPSETQSVANEIYDFLMQQNEGQNQFVCPRDPAVLDAIHLARAQLMLIAGNREKARQAASDLIKDVPASPLAREATRTLALVAWGDGSFRLASSLLDTLAEGKVGIPRDILRTVSADCLFLAGDYALAEKAYAAIQNETEGVDLAISAFHQRILSLLQTANDNKTWSQVADIIQQSQKSNKIPAERIWIAVWCLVEDIRKANQPDTAGQVLERLNPLLVDLPVDYSLRFSWQRALIALAKHDTENTLKIADGISQQLNQLPANASAELKENAPALRGHIALLKARTTLGTQNAAGLVELENIRKQYGKVSAAAASYLVEGRYLAALGRHAEAQERFLELSQNFQGEDATMAEFAELGLYEAAEEAAIQAPTVGDKKLKEAVEILEKFSESFPKSPLLFTATLRRAELLRMLGDFNRALLVLNGLIRENPDHPMRAQAEIDRADSLFGLSELRRERNGQLDRQRVSLAVAAYENVAGAWAKDADVLAEVRYKLALALLERAKAEASTDANATRLEARNVLLHTLSALKTVKNSSEFTYGTSGRVWLSRSILLLGQLYEDEGDTLEAIATYRIITELNRLLPQGEIRLPGQNAAESKLATLSQISNKK
ncbi:hypothetical protein EBR11_00080 [bacterium]|nr:hypothetical protein [bacterium]